MRAKTSRPLQGVCRMRRRERPSRIGSRDSDARVLNLGPMAILALHSVDPLESEMIDNVNQFLGTVAETKLGGIPQPAAWPAVLTRC